MVQPRALAYMFGLTVLQTLRRPFVPLLALIAASITSILPRVAYFEFGHRERFVRELAQANVRLTVLLAAIWLAPSVFARDRERGTLATLLARPIEPVTVVLGRYAGALAVIVSLLLVLSVAEAIALESRVAFGPMCTLVGAFAAPLLAVAVCSTLALPGGIAALVTLLVFVLGHVHGYFEAGIGWAPGRLVLRVVLPDFEATAIGPFARSHAADSALVVTRGALTAIGYLAFALALAERQQVPATGDRPCA